MDHRIEEKNSRKPRILVAPLDWGLGHATRCVPIIGEFLRQHAEVILAGEGAQAAILKTEFPQLLVLPLPGYRVQYAKSARGMMRKMIIQSPRIVKSIRQEHEWLLYACNEYKIDAVISDNRYGLYHRHLPCIFITHQLSILNPLAPWMEGWMRWKNYKYINRFTACWVPDTANEKNLAGKLSHPAKMPATDVHYIGLLSRLKKLEIAEKKNHLLFLLSGPEPQRTILEEIFLQQVAHYPFTATIVRGLPDEGSLIPSTSMISIYNHLTTELLNKEIAEAEFVIGRAGYSSIMDLLLLHKKTILIPTPGQTEQEYLANELSRKNYILSASQKNFNLDEQVKKAQQFRYTVPALNATDLSEAVGDFLKTIPITC